MNIQLNLTCLTLYTFIGSLLWGQAARSDLREGLGFVGEDRVSHAQIWY